MADPSSAKWSYGKGHIALFYESGRERLQLLVQYFKHGLDNNEQCILATSDSVEQVVETFRKLGVELSRAIKAGQFKIYEMNATYLPHGSFAAKYMLHNVEEFLQSARKGGYKGLRTAGEMSWLCGHSEALAEAMFYEYSVNTMIKENEDFVGLCLYPAADTVDIMKEDVRLTHTTVL